MGHDNVPIPPALAGLARSRRRAWIAAGAALALGGAALARAGSVSASDGVASTLERIARTGQIVIGHRQSESPFSYVADGQVLGYSIDLCRRVVDGLRRDLGLRQLDIRFVPVTPATRFVLVGNGSIDLECGVTTNTAVRRKLAEFSYPTFVTLTRFVSLRRHQWRSLGDLAGRSVVSTTGSINVEQLHSLSRAGNLNISVILSRDYKDAFELVTSGRAAAFVADEILLAGLIAASDDPQRYALSAAALSQPEPYGLLMPPGDLAFKQAVNRQLRGVFDSGEIGAIYRKWFESPIPPSGGRMDLPMSAELRELFRDPREYEE
ncbi:MAG: amino acid ABC transporter substrate-binding protein [Comamonas sp.]